MGPPTCPNLGPQPVTSFSIFSFFDLQSSEETNCKHQCNVYSTGILGWIVLCFEGLAFPPTAVTTPKHLKTLTNIPRRAKSPPVENHSSQMNEDLLKHNDTYILTPLEGKKTAIWMGSIQKGTDGGEERQEGTCIEHLLYSRPCVSSIMYFNAQTSPRTS